MDGRVRLNVAPLPKNDPNRGEWLSVAPWLGREQETAGLDMLVECLMWRYRDPLSGELRTTKQPIRRLRGGFGSRSGGFLTRAQVSAAFPAVVTGCVRPSCRAS